MLILDGATGTELDRRGIDVTLPLWSARAIIEAPDVLEDVHRSYLQAGAEVVVTNTFRTHARTLDRAGQAGRAGELTRQAVALAIRARDETRPDALVFGSVSPLEDCYRPDLAPSADDCRAEHALMIRDLLEAGVDHVLIETMCSAREATAAVQVARELAPGRWSVSFCLDVEGDAGRMMDGTILRTLLPELHGARFIGVNCVPADRLLGHLMSFRDDVPPGADLAAYGNVGRPDPVNGWVNTDAVDPDRYAEYALEWSRAGVELIGGCCGTTPETIRSIRELLV